MAAKSVTKINSGQVRFQDPEAVIFIPWAGGKPDEDGYDVHDIVGDTFSLTQDDANRTEIPWEFGDEPLDENISLGNRNLTMQCLDYQNDIMTAMFGWTEDGTDADIVYAPKQYEELICTVMLMFNDKCIVMPKVKMDSKTAFENLRSDIARGELGGTLYSCGVIFGSSSEVETGLFFMKYPSSSTKTFKIGGSTSGTTISVSSTGAVTVEKAS